jgi:hypothetical protein
MIRKAQRTEMSATDPTPDEIRERTEAIRQAWSPRERVRRSGFKRPHWTPPVFSEVEFGGTAGPDPDWR